MLQEWQERSPAFLLDLPFRPHLTSPHLTSDSYGLLYRTSLTFDGVHHASHAHLSGHGSLQPFAKAAPKQRDRPFNAQCAQSHGLAYVQQQPIQSLWFMLHRYLAQVIHRVIARTRPQTHAGAKDLDQT